MSDRIEELSKSYCENVSSTQCPIQRGLGPVPEHGVGRGMWSEALTAFLTTLRYIAPVTLLSLLFRLLGSVDSAIRSIIFSSDAQRDAVLKWLGEAGPARVDRLDSVWRHGWLLCGALDAALPGACAGHPPARLSIGHAQTIAEHFLGVEPVFSQQELENDTLSRHQEWKFVHYLDRVRQTLEKLSPPVSKQDSPCSSADCQFTFDFVARGCGLTAAQINQKNYFKIYPTSQQALDPGEITITIKGPNSSHGTTVTPPILGKAQMIRKNLLGSETKPRYTENALPVTQGTAYLRSYGKNDMNKTYYIPKVKCEIDIDVEHRTDHLRVGYTAKMEGKFEIAITSKGLHIVGSPFTVNASDNIIRTLENDSFCLEDGEEIDIVDVKSDRKVVLRIVDFVTEKMLLRENGTLEKISNDVAKKLMDTEFVEVEKTAVKKCGSKTRPVEEQIETIKKVGRFKDASIKVGKIKKVLNVWTSHYDENTSKLSSKKRVTASCKHSDIPDVVNSTLSDTTPKLRNNDNKRISDDEQNSLSFLMESKNKENEQSEQHGLSQEFLNTDNKPKPIEENFTEVDKIPVYEKRQGNVYPFSDIKSSGNPFIRIPSLEIPYDPIYVKEVPNKPVDMGNCRNISTKEETNDKMLNTNPFIDVDISKLERPKTPIYKIITGNVEDRQDSLFVQSNKQHEIDELSNNECLNPFFVDEHHKDTAGIIPIADFIIGAPVSLPPLLKATSPEPDIHFMMSPATNCENKPLSKDIIEEHSTVNLTSLNKQANTEDMMVYKESHGYSNSMYYNTILNNANDFMNNCEAKSNATSLSPYETTIYETTNRNVEVPHKDLWDSAYVSIDDNNSSPDNNNNNSIYEASSHQKNMPSEGSNFEKLFKMGPAELEIWQTHNDFNDVASPITNESRTCKLKRPVFTPIIEENERSLSVGMSETRGSDRISDDTNVDPVTVAFAELNEIFQEYYPISEPNSIPTITDKEKFDSIEINYTIKNNSVDSASRKLDVERHKPADKLEGSISEVQANVTEFGSASRALQNASEWKNKYIPNIQSRMEFGDNVGPSIVLEKKKYWDEKIRQIEENRSRQPKMKKNSSKQLKHDSLSKRKGKQIVKHFLNAPDPPVNRLIIVNNRHEIQNESSIENNENFGYEKLVDKWKKFWDEKLQAEKEEIEGEDRHRNKSPMPKGTEKYDACKPPSLAPLKREKEKVGVPKDSEKDIKREACGSPSLAVERQEKEKITDIYKDYEKEIEHHVYVSPYIAPVKQESAEEEVFKAFETSPKRFFGTSRKQIINKIDAFLKKPTVNNQLQNEQEINEHENGIVSSRINLFHNISNIENEETRKKYIPIQFSINNKIKPDLSSDKKNNQKDLFQAHKSTDKTEIVTLKDDTSPLLINDIIIQYTPPTQINILRKSSVSKSEMDIFNKANDKPGDTKLESYKSCDELPRINVKNVISLYENATKTSTISSINHIPLKSSLIKAREARSISPQMMNTQEATNIVLDKQWNIDEPVVKAINEVEVIDKYNIASLDETELHTEIIDLSIDSDLDKGRESPERDDFAEYKNRFKLAKKYFQSLEELRSEPETKSRKLNECELMLHHHTTQSPRDDQKKRTKKIKKLIKANTLPSSDIEKVWNQLNETEKDGATKLVKISEKFNVDDLFNDVIGEGKLSRRGSFKGIPHKKAVLETFKSMENLSDTKISSYEIAINQLSEFAKDNNIKNAQTYLTEYPFLPKTDPNKYHSRYDAKASGLISRKELLDSKPRRNSDPDLRLNTSFTADL